MTCHNLPPQPTSFIGRSDEIAEIESLLADPACRLLTLVGAGGVGKTRLAIEVATRVAVAFADGVYYVPLQSLSSPDNIISTITSVLNIQFSPSSDTRQQLTDYMTSKHILLILDNFEHLMPGTDLVDNFLVSESDLKLLVTSRAALNLRQEWVHTVRGMPIPERGSLGQAEDYSAIQLFAERARQIRSDFSLANENADVIRICQLVEGVPLAIELAATFTRALSCADIAREIQHNVDFLKTNLRNVEPRHQSMAAVFQWSWELLSAEERDVFKKLSVFRGGFWREAAEQVAGASLDVLVALVDKSLLRRAGSGRYEIHELLRQYAEEQLGATPEDKDTAHDRHCEYYAGFVDQRAADIRAFRQQEALQEIDNLRVAWRWAATQSKIAEFCVFLRTSDSIYESQAWHQEAAEDMKWFLEVLREDHPCGDKGIAYAMVLVELGFYSKRAGLLDQPNDQRILDGLSTLHRLDAKEELAWGNFMLDSQTTVRGDNVILGYEELTQHVRESLAIYTELGLDWGIAHALNTLGNVARDHGRYQEAIEYHRQALAIDRKLNDQRAMGWAKLGMGQAYVGLGFYNQAKPLLLECIEHAKAAGYTAQMSAALGALSVINREMGNLRGALQQVHQALKAAHELGNPFTLVNALLDLSSFLIQDNDEQSAVELLVLAQNHWGAPWKMKEEAQQLLEDLERRMPSADFAAAVARGKTLDLDDRVAELLEELGRGLDEDEQFPADIPAHVRVANRRLPDPLTERELEILQLIAAGLSNREIAKHLVIAPSTVKRHISNCYGKMNISSRTQAILQAQKLRLV